MTLTMAMILLGSLLVYGGWTNRSIVALARGDNTVAKPTIQAGQTGVRAATP